MTDFALELRSIEKRFGRTEALKGLSFAVPNGATCAFVGANGAGKTTTFSVIGGFLRPSKGEIWINGRRISKVTDCLGQVGILPQDMRFFEERTLESQLGLFAKLAGFSGIGMREEISRVLAAVGLLEKRCERASSLSRGMRVRLGVAQALIGSPSLILLDEPLAGLDPIVRTQVKGLIQSLHGNATVVVSSHELGELQTFCDYIVALDRGKCLFAGAMNAALGSGDQYLIYHLETLPENISELEAILNPRMLKIEHSSARILVQFGEEEPWQINQLVLPWLLKQAVRVQEVVHRKSLEETYLKLMDR